MRGIKDRFLGMIVLVIIYYGLYLGITGGLAPVDLTLGLVSSVIASALTVDILIRDPGKLSPARLFRVAEYLLRYFFVDEVKAHISVSKIILSPKLRIMPGFVRVPYYVRSDYAVLMIANSITNTPGTVTIDVDEKHGYLLVHWIDTRSTDPLVCRSMISLGYESYARKIFD